MGRVDSADDWGGEVVEMTLCSSRKYPYPHPPPSKKVNGNSKGAEGGWVAKSNIFIKKYGAKLEFRRGANKKIL